jgi:hypothetical protein
MGQNPSFTEKNNYDGVNTLDGSAAHPNKYELLEKRQGQIVQAIQSILRNQKADVLKRPVVGIATLVRRELQRQGGVVLNNEQEEIAFAAEYNTDTIVDELCKIVGFDDKNNYEGLKDAVDAYLSK